MAFEVMLIYPLWHVNNCLAQRPSRRMENKDCVQGMREQDFMSLMAVDKKAVDGQLRFILLKGKLGECVVTGDFDTAVLSELIREYCN